MQAKKTTTVVEIESAKSAAKMATPVVAEVNIAERPKHDRSTKQVEKVYVTVPLVGRVYRETSGRYVAQARRVAGGPRSRRRFATLKSAKESLRSRRRQRRSLKELTRDPASPVRDPRHRFGGLLRLDEIANSVT